MIGVVAAMGGEIEGDGDALLAGGEVPTIEGVGILGGGEAGILPDGPFTAMPSGVCQAAVVAKAAPDPLLLSKFTSANEGMRVICGQIWS